MDITFVADTCVLSETSKAQPDLQIIEWIKTTPRILIPMGALIEFEQGIYMQQHANAAKFGDLLRWRIELMSTGIRFLDTDQNVALQYGKMRACRALKALWSPNPKLAVQRGGQDLHIAAAAIANEYCVATMNIKDFLRIHEHFKLPGLYDPKADVWHVRPPGLTEHETYSPVLTG